MKRIFPLLTVLLCLSFDAFADGGACSRTTSALHRACIFSASDDMSVQTANCLNGPADELTQCLRDAQTVRRESLTTCVAKRESRDDVCDALGEGPYQPRFGAEFAADFVNPANIGHGVAPNPFMPIVAGNEWKYEKHVIDEQGDPEIEKTVVTVTDDTKLIDGITCRVVKDTVFLDDELLEETVDWFAQDLHGNVWYCGENTAEFLVFDGDHPKTPELQNRDGSFKVGVESAKAGIIMLGTPVIGRTYRQESSWANAEDIGKVVSLKGDEVSPGAKCAKQCLLTSEFSPLEPGHTESKYYVRGIGNILTVNDQTKSRAELTSFTHR